MRISIHIDSATTEELRAFIGAWPVEAPDFETEITVSLNGPESFSAKSPMTSADYVLAFAMTFISNMEKLETFTKAKAILDDAPMDDAEFMGLKHALEDELSSFQDEQKSEEK